MKPLASALVALILLTTGGSAEPAPTEVPIFDRVRVTNNPGGVVDNFLKDAMKFLMDGAVIEIEGECSSACTLFTTVPTACVLPGAKLRFHAPYMPLPSGAKGYSKGYIEWFTSQYPKGIQEWIAKRGGLTSEWLVLSGKELRKFVKPCK